MHDSDFRAHRCISHWDCRGSVWELVGSPTQTGYSELKLWRSERGGATLNQSRIHHVKDDGPRAGPFLLSRSQYEKPRANGRKGVGLAHDDILELPRIVEIDVFRKQALGAIV